MAWMIFLMSRCVPAPVHASHRSGWPAAPSEGDSSPLLCLLETAPYTTGLLGAIMRAGRASAQVLASDSTLLLQAELDFSMLAGWKTLLCLVEPSMTTAEPWVSVEAVASHLGVARDSVYRWIERRGLPAHKVGRLWKFRLSEVDDWVRAGGADEAEVKR